MWSRRKLAACSEDSFAEIEIIAHRGSGRGWIQPDAPPENTLPALAYAFSLAVDADSAEIDVRLTRDGELVAIHDATVDRTTDGHGRVIDHSFTELRELDAGRWKGSRYRGTRIPALEQVVAVLPPHKRLLIEIKGGPRAIPKLAAVLRACRRPAAQLGIIAFGLKTIAQAKQALPEHECYLVTMVRGRVAFRDALIRRAQSCGVDGIDVHYPASRALLHRIEESGLKTLVWTVNDVAGALRMAARSVGGITTDIPGQLRAALRTAVTHGAGDRTRTPGTGGR